MDFDFNGNGFSSLTDDEKKRLADAFEIINRKQLPLAIVDTSSKKKPFRDLVKQYSGYNVLPLNGDSKKIADNFKDLIAANFDNIVAIGKTYRGRINEFGNFIENYIRNDIEKNSIDIEMPTKSSGKTSPHGYPDYTINSNQGAIYGECKVYQEGSEESNFRSFYWKPDGDSKVTRDSSHILIAFSYLELTPMEYTITGFRLFDLYDLDCKTKIEINASNKDTLSLRQI